MNQHPIIEDPGIIPAARVVVVVENSTFRTEVSSEHGLALWIEIPGHQLLFDTGQSGLLRENTDALGLPLARVGSIILSHGHRDHSGGLAAALEAAPGATLYAHPNALKPKFVKCAKAGHSHRPVTEFGMPPQAEAAIRELGRRLVPTTHPTTIRGGVGITGAIPRRHSYEVVAGRFYHDEACQKPDPMSDDQAIFFEAPEGLILLLGCAHAGVVNTMEYVAELTGHNRFYCVMGGMHLESASRTRSRQSSGVAPMSSSVVNRSGTNPGGNGPSPSTARPKR
ncbi:MAG: MBL fold metallo-hydrolase [bacterium]|nr:MBL fold metallo-hydrolase [bacterium]